MKDERKTKKQLAAELMELRQKVAALEASMAEHERAEAHARAEACSRAEERNRALYEFSPDGIVTVGLDGRIIECNEAYAGMLGYSHKELEGFPFQDTMPRRWHDFCDKVHQEVMERGYSYEFEKECIKKDGTVFPASMRSWRIDDESGEPIGIWSIVRDITERKRGEEEFRRYSERLEELVEDKTRTLRESGESFRSLAENANDGILITITVEGSHVYANKRAAEMTGYSVDELLKTSIKDLTHPDEFRKIMRRYRKRLAGEDVPGQYETIFTRKDGKNVPIELSAAQTTWHGQPAVMIIIRDIAERKRAEKALRESEREKAAILGNMREHVIYQDPDMQVLWANKAAGESVGLSSEQLVGRYCYEVWNQRDKPCVGCPVVHARESGRSQEAEMSTPDGRMWLVRGYPVQDIDGKIAGAVEVTLDITERKRAEERLAKINECFVNFGPDPSENINRLTALCGETLDATCALYNRLDGGMLCSWGQWNTPPDYNPVDQPEGHICYDVIRQDKSKALVVRNLFETPYAQTDPNVIPYGLQTYVGWPVKFDDAYVGSLCVVYQRDFIPSEADEKFMETIASAIGVEEERKRAEEALRISDNAIASSITAIAIAEFAGNLTYVNTAFLRMWGYEDRDEVLGKPAVEFWQTSEEATRVIEALQNRGDWIGELVAKRKDGSLFDVQLSASIVTDENGKPTNMMASFVDITERKRVEEALRESEEKFRTLAEQSPNMIFINRKGKVVYVNRRCEEVMGYNKEEFYAPDFTFLTLIASEDQEFIKTAFASHLKGEEVEPYEYGLVTKDGRRIEAIITSRLIDYENERAILGIVTDISERKRAEETLELKIAHLAALGQASQAVTASLELDQVLAKIISLAGAVAASDYTSVILVDEAGNLGPSTENLLGIPALEYRVRPKGLTNWIVRQRKAAIIDEIKDGIMTPKPGKGAPRAANPHIVEAGVKSVAGLPLIAKDRLLGVLYLHSLTPGAFHDQLSLLTAFANQAAIALENARLYGAAQRELAERAQAEEELRQYAGRLDSVHTIEEAILAAQSPEEIAQAVLSRIRQLIPCQHAALVTFDFDAQESTILAITAEGQTGVGSGAILPLEGVDTGVEKLRQGEIIVQQDLLNYPDPPPTIQTLQAMGVRSYLAAPLISHGELIGILGLRDPVDLSSQHIDAARELADQLAIALQQARLHEQVQRHAEELEQRVTERTRALERRTVQLQVAAEVARDATTAHDLDELLDSAVGLIRERFGFYQAGIFLVDERGEYAVLRAATGEAGRQMLEAGHRLKVGEVGIVGHVTGSGQPRIALDVGADAVHFDNPFLPETRSELALPLKVGDRIIGALDVQSVREAAFDEDDVATLQILADQLAVAIERTRLFEQTQATLEQRLRTIIANVPIVLFAQDSEGVFTLIEGKGLDALGLRPGELVGKSVFDVYRDTPNFLETFRRAIAGEAIAPVVDVGGLLFEVWCSPLRDESGEITGIIGVATDVTERKRAEEALRESQQLLQKTFASLRDAVFIIDAETAKIVDCNPAAYEIFGYSREEMVDRTTAFLHVDEAALEEFRKHLYPAVEEKGFLFLPEFKMQRKNGDIFPTEHNVVPFTDEQGKHIGWVSVVRDITERKHLEEQMRLQERLAAVGQLAGGIAHDFNNFLTTIMLYAQILLCKPNLPSDMASVAETILEESRRAAQLVRRLLDFSRRSLIETRPVDLASFVEETADILRRTLPENIQLLVDVGSEEYIVNADPARIQQVVMNLVLNARDAMPDGGKLRIDLSCIEIKEEDEPPVAEMASGEWVCLTISDTGIGMTEEVQSHLFEPFFTTKGPKGTGLGLAQVYGVVKRHDGHIGVETCAGQGTTFRVYLRPYKTAGLAESPQAPSAPPQGHGEIILLVEDEDRVREAGREILESLGYRVLIAANGQEAVQVYRSAERVDLVLTDLIMPEMGGKELAQELRKIAPRVKVLAITGYTLVGDVEELKQAGILDIIHKPFEVKTLAEAVRQTLDAVGATRS